MNNLAIDFGTKRIGLALSINGIISPLKTIPNNTQTIALISDICHEYRVDNIWVGLSEGFIKKLQLEFISQLKASLKLPVESVEESVSTLEAQRLKASQGKKADIDALSAAVILSRVIS